MAAVSSATAQYRPLVSAPRKCNFLLLLKSPVSTAPSETWRYSRSGFNHVPVTKLEDINIVSGSDVWSFYVFKFSLSFLAFKVKGGSPTQGGEASFQPGFNQWTWKLPVPTGNKPVNKPADKPKTQEDPGSWEGEERAVLQTTITGTWRVVLEEVKHVVTAVRYILQNLVCFNKCQF